LRVFPPEPATDERAYLICVPERLLPLLCGALKTLEEREAWASDDDWRLGYQWIVETQVNLMHGCVDRIVEMQEKTYRLLDTALNGTLYSVTPAVSPLPTPPSDPTKATITPDIPDAPSATAPQLLTNIALRNRIDRLVDLVDNGFNGTDIVPPASTSAPAVRANLEEIRLLLEASGTNDADIESILNLILLALG
jgi:hypothetical protein